MRQMKRYKPSSRNHFWTQTLGVARRESSASLHQGKGSIRTWLYFKNIRSGGWGNTVPAALQYCYSDLPLGNPVDMDVITAGNQSPVSFPTQAKLWAFYLVDRGAFKLNFKLLNGWPTAGIQQMKAMTVSWYDTNTSGATFMNALAAATPALNYANLKERLKQFYTVQIREYTWDQASTRWPKIKCERKWNITKLMGYNGPWERPQLNPSAPITIASAYNFYGVAGTSPVAPTSQWYHHFAVINISALTATTSGVFPVSEATSFQLDQDVAYYCKFYNALTYYAPIDL